MNYAIIVAAGKGKRMNSKVNKILLLLDEKPILYHSIKPFEKSALIDKIFLIAGKEDVVDLGGVVRAGGFKKVEIVEGGEERQDSVYNGLRALDAKDEDIVLIHNGVNPFVSSELISKVVDGVKIYGACAVAYRAKDTIKEVDEEGFVLRTLDRNRLWQMQTPQAAKYKLLVRAFVKAYNDGYYGTDDVELIERIGERVKVIECDRENFKITQPADLENAKLLLNADRVGVGLDSHRFTDEMKKLVLGGVEILGEKGIEANSDGDVILHSLFNALSSAVGGRSLGFYADHLCNKGVKDSVVYLKVALEMVREKGFKINNIGVMVEGSKPRLDKYEELIKGRIAEICGVDYSKVGLAVTSGEDLSAFGKGEGVQVYSIVSLRGGNGS